MSDDAEICGAETHSGEPCQFPTDTTPCPHHGGDSSTHADSKLDADRVTKALIQSDGVVTQAADLLDCSPSTVRRFCREYDQCDAIRQLSRELLASRAKSTFRKSMESWGTNPQLALDAAKTVARLYDDDGVERQDVTSDGDKVRGVIMLPERGGGDE